jgi:hypothetical protein
MKKLIILFAIFFVTINLAGQGFFKPVPNDLFSAEQTADRTIKGTSTWLFRPAITVTAVQWNWDKDSKMFNAQAFQSAGLGIGYQHFTTTSATDPTPFSNYGANLLLLLGTDVSVAGTFTGFGIVNLGVLYNFTQKAPGILCGVQLKF